MSDPDAITFDVPGEPRGKGRPIASTISGHVRMRTPAKTVAYEGLIAMAAAQVMRGRPPFDGAVLIEVDVRHAPAPSWSKRKRADALTGRARPCRKPDIDNVLKAVGDAGNGVLWHDDAQIVEATIVRHYAELAGLTVRVSRVRADDERRG